MASLQNLCEVKSLSIFKSSDQDSVPETSDLGPLPEVPQVDLGIPAMESLRARGVSVTRMSPETIDRDPLPEVPQVDLGVPDLDALRASGVSITRVAPASIRSSQKILRNRLTPLGVVQTNGKLS